jgi:hypothetical protein
VGCAVPMPSTVQRLPSNVQRLSSNVPAQCAVFASRGKLAIRSIETGEAIQCRERNIRIYGLRHWIAARLDALRIASAAALAMTDFLSYRVFNTASNPPPRGVSDI